MAKKIMTEEERLEKALVAEEEWPYVLPEGWKWVYMVGGFAECLDKFRKPINATERAKREGNIPYYGATGQVGWIDDYLTDEHLVLVGEDGAPFYDLLKDKAYIIEGKAWVNNHAHILRSFYGEHGNKLLMHYLNIFNYHGYVNGTTRLKLTQTNMRKIPFPLPPINRIERIVAQIEILFSKLDQAQEKIETVLESSENRKSAILHKAFTGELTKKWREENKELLEVSSPSIPEKDLISEKDQPYEIPDNWKWTTLGKVCSFKGGGTPSKRNPAYWNGDIPWASIKDLKGDELWNTIDFITEEGLNNSSSNLCKKDNLILATRISPGKSIIARIDVAINQDLKIVETDLNIEFLHYYFKLIEDVFLSKSSGSTVQGINLTNVKSIKIPIPCEEEQVKITRIIKDLLGKEDLIIEHAEILVEKMGEIKKAILAKAFRGEYNLDILIRNITVF